MVVEKPENRYRNLIELEEPGREAFMDVKQCRNILEFSLIIALQDGAWFPFKGNKDLRTMGSVLNS